MNARRANGEGSVYQRGDGKWCAAVTADDPATGRRKRTVLYGRTRAEVKAKLKAALERVDDGAPVKDATTTVAEWMTHWCRTSLAASDRKPATKTLYRILAAKHISPEPLGAKPLDKLRPSHIEALVVSLRERGLSQSTVRSAYTVLRRALDGAVRDGLMAKNPAAAVDRPTVTRSEARHLTKAEVISLLAAAQTSRFHPALVLAAATGMRRGEVLALSWANVDLDAGVLRVQGTLSRLDGQLVISTPKTDRSRRSIRLSPPLVTVLRAHRKQQAKERIAAANVWHPSDLVFTTELGQPIDPRNFLRVVQAAAKRAGLEGVGVHTLRHSAATTLLEDGHGIKTVSELLGHTSISVTGDIYAHVTDTTAQAAADALSVAIGL